MLPRHAFNFLTLCGLTAHLILRVWDAEQHPGDHRADRMRRICIAALLTGTLYHGMHCLGHAHLADRYLMAPDFVVVAAGGLALCIMAEEEHQFLVRASLLSLFLFWCVTFYMPYNPYNVSQCYVHIAAYVVHLFVAAQVQDY